eukprot:357715-Chlamydomonas_euryale.AAC.4
MSVVHRVIAQVMTRSVDVLPAVVKDGCHLATRVGINRQPCPLAEFLSADGAQRCPPGCSSQDTARQLSLQTHSLPGSEPYMPSVPVPPLRIPTPPKRTNCNARVSRLLHVTLRLSTDPHATLPDEEARTSRKPAEKQPAGPTASRRPAVKRPAGHTASRRPAVKRPAGPTAAQTSASAPSSAAAAPR